MKGNLVMSKKSNMYKLSVAQWNPFKGCEFGCTYCEPSFQRQAKRQKHLCQQCYDYEPHAHPERLDQELPGTKFMQFVFTCSSSDIAFCPTDYLKKIVCRIKQERHKNFLTQSKNPETFNRIKWPSNVILGTTLETNKNDLYEGLSEAPSPSQRYEEFLKIQHPLKTVTIEPVIDFDLEILLEWMKNLKPCLIWIGFDTKNCHLPEPKIEKVKQLHWELSKAGFVVILKSIREA